MVLLQRGVGFKEAAVLGSPDVHALHIPLVPAGLGEPQQGKGCCVLALHPRLAILGIPLLPFLCALDFGHCFSPRICRNGSQQFLERGRCPCLGLCPLSALGTKPWAVPAFLVTDVTWLSELLRSTPVLLPTPLAPFFPLLLSCRLFSSTKQSNICLLSVHCISKFCMAFGAEILFLPWFNYIQWGTGLFFACC